MAKLSRPASDYDPAWGGLITDLADPVVRQILADGYALERREDAQGVYYWIVKAHTAAEKILKK